MSSCYLRLWRVETEDRPAWRSSVESPHTGEKQGFSSLEALYAFLAEKTGGGVPTSRQRLSIGFVISRQIRPKMACFGRFSGLIAQSVPTR